MGEALLAHQQHGPLLLAEAVQRSADATPPIHPLVRFVGTIGRITHRGALGCRFEDGLASPVRARPVDGDPGRDREDPCAQVLVAPRRSLGEADERFLRGVLGEIGIGREPREVPDQSGAMRFIEGLQLTGQKAILTPTIGRIGRPFSNSSIASSHCADAGHDSLPM